MNNDKIKEVLKSGGLVNSSKEFKRNIKNKIKSKNLSIFNNKKK